MNEIEAKIVSFDLKASFGFLKKFDINEDIYLTYNCIHKPALLGIFGAIIGLKGYYQAYTENKNEPEYFEKLKSMKIGIQPINSSNGNFQKSVIVYNNSIGYASKEEGGNLIIKEQTLIAPNYRIYFLLQDEYSELIYNYLKKKEAEFIPYLGKNDFQLYWEEPREYFAKRFTPTSPFSISSLFIKDSIVKDFIKRNIRIGLNSTSEQFFIYFERLPIDFSSITKNYELAEFVFTNATFKQDFHLTDLFEIETENGIKQIIQVF